jgi:poly-gamma-glutamate synthesis protein (capsule biosynthesis protein)
LIRDELSKADIVYGNLENGLHNPPVRIPGYTAGFYADPVIGTEALRLGNVTAVGLANNQVYGAAAIIDTLKQLREFGIAWTGAGLNRAEARAPAIVERGGVRVGFLQRTSIYWDTGHEAGKTYPGIAPLKGHTAYHVPVYAKRVDDEIVVGSFPLNRPGVPSEVITWADPDYLNAFKDDIAALRERVDVVIASCHWGLRREPLQYMHEIAHAAIDSGADLVMGHGPHDLLAVESYKGRPIFYGLGSFCFNLEHLNESGRNIPNWKGLLVKVSLVDGKVSDTRFSIVRINRRSETERCSLADCKEDVEYLVERSAALGAKLTPLGDEVEVEA